MDRWIESSIPDPGREVVRRLSPNDLDIVFIQQTCNPAERKPRLLDRVFLRVDRVVGGGAEVGLFQIGMIEGRPREITMRENGAAQTGFGEIHFLQTAMGKDLFDQFHPVEGGMIQRAMIQCYGQAELIGIFPVEAPHFAFLESNIAETGLGQVDQAEVAMAEGAVDEQDAGEIHAGKIAMGELAIFIFSLGQERLPEVLFLEDRVGEQRLGRHSLLHLPLQ